MRPALCESVLTATCQSDIIDGTSVKVMEQIVRELAEKGATSLKPEFILTKDHQERYRASFQPVDSMCVGRDAFLLWALSSNGEDVVVYYAPNDDVNKGFVKVMQEKE